MSSGFKSQTFHHWEESLLRFVLVVLLGAVATGFAMAFFSRSIDPWSFLAGGATALLADRLQRHSESTFTISIPTVEIFDDPEPDEGGPHD